MTIFERIETVRKERGACAMALIDPDSKNDQRLDRIMGIILESDFDAVLVGGSTILDDDFKQRIQKIRNLLDLPIILFPGSSLQLSPNADAVLYLSLLSGRNPQYLIGEHVQSAPIIQNYGLETIPTGYILLDGGKPSSVQIMSNTNPIPMEKTEIIISHALAGEY